MPVSRDIFPLPLGGHMHDVAEFGSMPSTAVAALGGDNSSDAWTDASLASLNLLAGFKAKRLRRLYEHVGRAVFTRRGRREALHAELQRGLHTGSVEA